MLNKKSTVIISCVILEEELNKMSKLINEYNKRFNTNYSRSDFVREAIHHELLLWEE